MNENHIARIVLRELNKQCFKDLSEWGFLIFLGKKISLGRGLTTVKTKGIL